MKRAEKPVMDDTSTGPGRPKIHDTADAGGRTNPCLLNLSGCPESSHRNGSTWRAGHDIVLYNCVYCCIILYQSIAIDIYPAASDVRYVATRAGRGEAWGRRYRKSLIDAHVLRSAGPNMVCFDLAFFGDYLLRTCR